LTAFPFVFVKYRADKRVLFLNHEKNTLTPAVGINTSLFMVRPRVLCDWSNIKQGSGLQECEVEQTTE
jgi:hypothetical protein